MAEKEELTAAFALKVSGRKWTDGLNIKVNVFEELEKKTTCISG